jgi:hypothetical protein
MATLWFLRWNVFVATSTVCPHITPEGQLISAMLFTMRPAALSERLRPRRLFSHNPDVPSTRLGASSQRKLKRAIAHAPQNLHVRCVGVWLDPCMAMTHDHLVRCSELKPMASVGIPEWIYRCEN